MMKTIVALSGGLDSAVMLSDFMRPGSGFTVVKTVSFHYGSKHGYFEARSARMLADHYGVPHARLDASRLFWWFKSALLQDGGKLPEGHYEEESMRQTVVPFRNGIFLSILIGMAESLGCDRVAIGCHAGDHHIYPDCRSPFLDAMREAAELGTDTKVKISAPFQNALKRDIVKLGIGYGTPFIKTRTCYADQSVACGRCGSCQERLEAFAANGTVDPIEYVTREIMPKKTA